MSSRDLDAIDDYFSPDFVSHNTPPELPGGVAGVKAFFAVFRDAFPDAEITIDQLVHDGDWVAVATTTCGTHTGAALVGIPASGRRVCFTGMDMVRVVDGRIVEHRGLTDMVGLLRQLTA
jgi:predicted ester cyclase